MPKRKPPKPLSRPFEYATSLRKCAELYLKGESVLVITQNADNAENFLDKVFAEVERIEKDAADLPVDKT